MHILLIHDKIYNLLWVLKYRMFLNEQTFVYALLVRYFVTSFEKVQCRVEVSHVKTKYFNNSTTLLTEELNLYNMLLCGLCSCDLQVALVLL